MVRIDRFWIVDASDRCLQSNVLKNYLAAVRATLTAALTLQDFSSQVRHKGVD